MNSYWYLGTPYTNYPEGHEAAFVMAAQQTALLLKAGVNVYSPIAHTHPIAVHGDMDNIDPDLWRRVDKPMVDMAHGLIYLEDGSSLKSSGLHHELKEFVKAGKPIVFMQPGVVPAELTQPRDSQPVVKGDALDAFIAKLQEDYPELYDDPRKYSL